MTTEADGGNHGVGQKSIQALLAAYPGETDPQTIIRRLAREKVAKARTANWNGPPFCPKELASFLGIRCKEVDHDIGGEGRILLRSNKRLVIEYRSGRLQERQRFTIFHELAHTLFPDYCKFLPYHQAAKRNPPDYEKKFEYLCDVAAAEMLFPIEDFEKDSKALEWRGFEAVHMLRKRYIASIDATTYRLVELTKDMACATVFLTDQRGTHAGRGPLWVRNCSPNKEFKCYIPCGTSPPFNSVTLHCYRNGAETSDAAKETWWVNGNPRSWLVQAAKLPDVPESPEYPKVVALLFPQSYAKNGTSVGRPTT